MPTFKITLIVDIPEAIDEHVAYQITQELKRDLDRQLALPETFPSSRRQIPDALDMEGVTWTQN